MRGAATKDTTNISAPAPKSNATTEKQVTKPFHGTEQKSKEKHKQSRLKLKDAYPDRKQYKTFPNPI